MAWRPGGGGAPRYSPRVSVSPEPVPPRSSASDIDPQVYVRRRLLVGGVALALVLAVVLGWSLTRPRPPELPGGGREVFPSYRLYGYSGYPNSTALGRLGTGDLEERVREIVSTGAEYRSGRRVMPVMELIAVTAQTRPGADGLYRARVKDSVIEEWLAVARRHDAMLLLNIQPGRSPFLDEVRAFERWLREPDVGLALDPEWAVGPDEVPGKVYGHTTGPDLDAVAVYVAGLVREGDLPEKVLLYHQLHEDIVSEEGKLVPHDGVVLVKSVDGIGSPAAKVQTWQRIVARTPKHVRLGFKLFFEEDVERGKRLMTPQEVLDLTPTPDYVLYE